MKRTVSIWFELISTNYGRYIYIYTHCQYSVAGSVGTKERLLVETRCDTLVTSTVCPSEEVKLPWRLSKRLSLTEGAAVMNKWNNNSDQKHQWRTWRVINNDSYHLNWHFNNIEQYQCYSAEKLSEADKTKGSLIWLVTWL